MQGLMIARFMGAMVVKASCKHWGRNYESRPRFQCVRARRYASLLLRRSQFGSPWNLRCRGWAAFVFRLQRIWARARRTFGQVGGLVFGNGAKGVYQVVLVQVQGFMELLSNHWLGSPCEFKLQRLWPQALYRCFHFSQANPEMKSRSIVACTCEANFMKESF